MNCQEIIRQAIDLHVHVGPEIIPRKFTLPELLAYEKGKLKGVGIKNHFFPTISMSAASMAKGLPLVVNSVVLNRYVGGFNADIVRASAALSDKSIIVWFPTLHAQQFLQSQKFEIPDEWLAPQARGRLKLRPTRSIEPLIIFDAAGEISEEVKSVLDAIQENGAILATGHLAWRESYELVKFAVKRTGLKKVIITHPIYQKINMPTRIQKELAGLGAFMEQCYSMYSIDKVPISKIAKQIRDIGADNVILSSDVGQVFSKSPSESLIEFVSLLEKEGVREEEIKTMLVRNPRRLVGI